MDETFEKRLPKPEDLKGMTEECLKAAFAGESQAAEKYMVFAEQADGVRRFKLAPEHHFIALVNIRVPDVDHDLVHAHATCDYLTLTSDN